MLKRIFATLALATIAMSAQAQVEFGTGIDGPLNVPASTTQTLATPDTTVTVPLASGNTVVPVASTAGFVNNMDIILINYRGPGAGTYEFAKVGSVGVGSLTLAAPTTRSYASGSDTRAIRVWQFSSVTVGSAATLTGSASTLVIRSVGNITLQSSAAIDMSRRGFPGGGIAGGGAAFSGVSYDGGSSTTTSANFGAGGGGDGGGAVGAGGGGGGSYGSQGVDGTTNGGAAGGQRGNTYGASFPTDIFLGSGGGGGGANLSGMTEGGAGGGIIILFAPTITIGANAFIGTDGENGEDGVDTFTLTAKSGSGGGSGGSVLLGVSSAGNVVLNGGVFAQGGARGLLSGSAGAAVGFGGNGGDGRIHIRGTVTGTGSLEPTATFSPGIDPPAAAAAWSAYE